MKLFTFSLSSSSSYKDTDDSVLRTCHLIWCAIINGLLLPVKILFYTLCIYWKVLGFFWPVVKMMLG